MKFIVSALSLIRDNFWRYFGALLAVGAGMVMFFTPVGGSLERASFDIPFALRRDVPVRDAVLVYIDEESHKELNQHYAAPWDRGLHAQFLNKMKAGGARLVVFDVLFDQSSPDQTSANAQFAAAIKNHGGVILAADYVMSKSVQGIISTRAILPEETFARSSAGWGNVKLLYDPDYGVREHFPNLQEVSGHEEFPTLAWTAAKILGAPALDNAKKARRYVNYYGPPGSLPSVSYFLNFVPDAVPENFYRDKIVFVGALLSADYSGKGKDEFATPYTRWNKGFAPGVEIHATTLLNLIRNDWLTRLPWSMELGLVLVAGVFLGGCLPHLRPLTATALAAASGVFVCAAGCALAWHFRVWFNWMLIASIQIPIALTWALAFQSLQAHVEQAALKRSLLLHLGSHRVEQILKNQNTLKPGAEEKEVSIIFTDIANYSKIMQRGMLGQMVPLMNDYFEVAIGCVHERDGTIIKLIGDSIFAIWNAPQSQDNHADLACKAAVLLRERLVSFDQQHKAQFSFRTRVGLHTEKVFVGNFGSQERFDYTAMGNGVNLAARLEGANKILGTETLVSDEFASRLRDKYVMRHLGQFRFKGFDHVIIVHELLGKPEHEHVHREWMDAFADALAHFKNKRFVTAEAGFQRAIELRRKAEASGTAMVAEDLDEDGPSRFYLAKISQLTKSLPPDWIGEVSLDEK